MSWGKRSSLGELSALSLLVLVKKNEFCALMNERYPCLNCRWRSWTSGENGEKSLMLCGLTALFTIQCIYVSLVSQGMALSHRYSPSNSFITFSAVGPVGYKCPLFFHQATVDFRRENVRSHRIRDLLCAQNSTLKRNPRQMILDEKRAERERDMISNE